MFEVWPTVWNAALIGGWRLLPCHVFSEEEHAISVIAARTPMDFYVPAKGYAEAAKMIVLSPLRNGRSEMTYLPIHMLLGFSVELYLKSWLSKEGLDENTLRRKPYGHDLKRLYSEAKSNGFPFISALESLIHQLHGPHNDFTYRYFRLDLSFNNTDLRCAFDVIDRLDTEVTVTLVLAPPWVFNPATSCDAKHAHCMRRGSIMGEPTSM